MVNRIELRSSPGFTLVELLAVIAIVSVLVAMLLPTIEHAVLQAGNVACANNLKQQYFGVNCYAGDFRDQPPYTTMDLHTNNLYGYSAYWKRNALGLLVPEYLGDISVYMCPSRKVDTAAFSIWRAAQARNFAPSPNPFSTEDVWGHYASGWAYGPGVVAANWRPTGAFMMRPTIANYAKTRSVLIADCNTLSGPGGTSRFYAPFHNNGKWQNFVRVDGSFSAINNFWDTLAAYTPLDYWHTYAGAPYYFWWMCFGKY